MDGLGRLASSPGPKKAHGSTIADGDMSTAHRKTGPAGAESVGLSFSNQRNAESGRDLQSEDTCIAEGSALGVYHVRRKMTHYMCGWDDLEREVVRMIQNSDSAA